MHAARCTHIALATPPAVRATTAPTLSRTRETGRRIASLPLARSRDGGTKK
jgi:hypothetical protein